MKTLRLVARIVVIVGTFVVSLAFLVVLAVPLASVGVCALLTWCWEKLVAFAGMKETWPWQS